jgi:hypothetical protein
MFWSVVVSACHIGYLCSSSIVEWNVSQLISLVCIVRFILNLYRVCLNYFTWFTKNQYQLVALYYLFVGWFSDMFLPDLIGHLQGDL